MKKIFGLLVFTLITQSAFAQAKKAEQAPEKKVVYTYKKYEKFDFDDLNIEGDSSSYGEISISPMQERSFQNKLPYRKSFAKEIRKGIQRVR